MNSVKVLLLFSTILPSQSEKYSLYYTYSSISKSLISEDIYEFYNSVELNDFPVNFCNSVNKAKFLTKLCEESKRLFKNESDELRYKREWLQINLNTLMRHMRNENRTNDTDLHVLQWRHGCAVERHSNDSVIFLQGTDEYAYDGENLTFNLSMHWKPLVLEHNIIWNRESVSSLEKKCVETLTSFIDLQREDEFIMESPPEVYSSVKESGSSEQQVLVCLATGFYPKHVEMEIIRDQTPLPDEQLNSSGIGPNADGSFQLKKSLEILRSERSRYQCVVNEWILSEESMNGNMAFENSSLQWMRVGVGAIVLLGYLIVVPIIGLASHRLIKYFKHPEKQKTLKTPSQVKLLTLYKTQMEPELLKEIRTETRAGLAFALNAASDDENAADDSLEKVQTEKLHETQSLCEAKETPAAVPPAAQGAMGSKKISLPNFAMEREDTDQNYFTQNALRLALIQHFRFRNISMPNLAVERKDTSDSSGIYRLN